MATKKTAPTKEQIAQAFALFKAAASYDEIASTVAGLPDAEAAADAVERAIAASPITRDQTAARVLELERLDSLHKAVWAKALRGDVSAIDRVLRIGERRLSLLGEPERTKAAITEAFEESLDSITTTGADGTLIAACRQVARQIDYAVAHGSSLEATKALYLLPHLMNGLRELGATPAARAALAAAAPAPADVPEKGAGIDDLDDFKKRRTGGTST